MKRYIFLSLLFVFPIINAQVKQTYNVITEHFDLVDNILIESSDKTINSSLINGNDTTGDGSLSTPYRTLVKALESLNKFINSTITIQLDSGNFVYNASEIKPIINDLTFLENGFLIIIGTTNTIGTYSLSQNGTYSTLYSYSGDSLESGWFIIKNASNHYPIGSTSSSAIWTCDATLSGSYSIYENKTTIVNSEGDPNWLDLHLNGQSVGAIQFENIKFDDNNRFRFQTGGNQIYFYRCNLDQPYDMTLNGNPPVVPAFVDCKQTYLELNTATLAIKISDNTGGRTNFRDCVIRNIGGDVGIILSNSIGASIANTLFDSCQYESITGTVCGMQKSITFKGITNAMIIQSDGQIFGNEINSELILFNVTNLFSYGDGNQFNEIINGGFIDLEGSFTNLFNEIPGYQSLEKYQINLPGLYQKEERIITDIINNTSGNIEIGDTIQNKAIYIDYSISRNALYELGTIAVSGKDDTIIDDVMNVNFDDAGITFSKNVTGSTINIGYVLSSATYDAELNFQIRRSMK